MDARKLARAMRTIRQAIRNADPKSSIACESCGTRTVRGGQLAHRAGCPTIMVEMELMDIVEGFGHKLVRTS